MPIITAFVKGIKQPPYRNKFGTAGGLRQDNDFSEILLRFENNGCQLLVHENSMGGAVVLEVHQGMDKNGQQLETCQTEFYELTTQQCFELAVYLLSTVTVR